MYIIKKHYEATEKNTNFVGEIRDYYEGKAGYTIGLHNEFPDKWEIETFGYVTLAGAKKGLKAAIELANWETNCGYWNVTAELIEC